MTQSPIQQKPAATFPAETKPELKTGVPPTDAEKKAQADKAQGDNNVKS